ncbi:MAG: LAGLIDADG family homing endonuclease [bacterium]|nr:LAGLIDADG family homing endonuclease [bacterium]
MIKKTSDISHTPLLAYIVGLALGDGNLSNPNGRATRLRITCDLKYPKLIQKIQTAISTLLPKNKVSIVKRSDNCLDISCYSNKLEGLLGWYAKKGSKIIQNVSIPNWIKEDHEYKISCLRGLIETDGSIYTDRKYRMVMFTNASHDLAKDVLEIIISLGFKPRFYIANNGGHTIYRIRIAKNVSEFLDLIKPAKE